MRTAVHYASFGANLILAATMVMLAVWFVVALLGAAYAGINSLGEVETYGMVEMWWTQLRTAVWTGTAFSVLFTLSSIRVRLIPYE